MSEPATLKRSLGLPMITFYGVGTIVGAGFYALVGHVSAAAGLFTPLAFLVASLVAMFSAFSFAELSSRMPYSAGEAHYVQQAFGRRWLAGTVGWMVIATGVVSAATLANAFAGFVSGFVDAPNWLTASAMVLAIGGVAAWGIGQSALLVLVVTITEIGGLLFVLCVAGDKLAMIPARMADLTPSAAWLDWSGILLGAYLAFYAFVGFEDMVNIAEEVKRPERNLPIAILTALGMTALLYVIVGLVAVLAVPQQELIDSDSPLSLIVAPVGAWAAGGIRVIGMLAGINGALVQIVMAARVAYGLAQKGQAPSAFARVNRSTRTPLPATVVITCVVLALALWFPLTTLAKITSTILLGVYALVNASLWRIKRRGADERTEGPTYPIWMCVTGFVLCLAFLSFHAAWEFWLKTR